MKIVSWNVNGLRAIKNKGFLDWFKNYNADIICLQETKLQEDQIEEDLKNPLDYHSYWSFAEKKGYSGVVIYSKEEPLHVSYGLGEPRFDNEGRVVRVDYKNFILMNIYFPNGQKDDNRLKFKMEFYDLFLAYVNRLKNEGKNIIVCGDYNTAHKEIDIKNAKANENRSGFLQIEREWMDKYISNGYTDTFRKMNPDTVKYSWWSYMFNARKNNAGWRIDYFFVNNEFAEKIKNADIDNSVMGSDHCPIILEI
ncbi:MAG: exodeoxyribonuclease III [Candidatus Delongbacteria bacterium]|nr:exodeoxyribonuclease III [Candidatus Delongbacteria bacterium]MBN2833771.1 exodeoxyribonuclease III [Candidatus Delongbacteria bacterium]